MTCIFVKLFYCLTGLCKFKQQTKYVQAPNFPYQNIWIMYLRIRTWKYCYQFTKNNFSLAGISFPGMDQVKEPEKKVPMVYICGGISFTPFFIHLNLVCLFYYEISLQSSLASFLYSDCHAENELKPKDPIRCRECGYRNNILQTLFPWFNIHTCFILFI